MLVNVKISRNCTKQQVPLRKSHYPKVHRLSALNPSTAQKAQVAPSTVIVTSPRLANADDTANITANNESINTLNFPFNINSFYTNFCAAHYTTCTFRIKSNPVVSKISFTDGFMLIILKPFAGSSLNIIIRTLKPADEI